MTLDRACGMCHCVMVRSEASIADGMTGSILSVVFISRVEFVGGRILNMPITRLVPHGAWSDDETDGLPCIPALYPERILGYALDGFSRRHASANI